MRLIALLLTVSFLMAACATQAPLQSIDDGDPTEITNAAEFINYLERNELAVLSAHLLVDTRSFQSGAKNIYDVTLRDRESRIFIYEYDDAGVAHSDSRRLNFGTLVRTRQGVANFRGTYHPMTVETELPVFHRDRLIVVHVGDDAAVANRIHRVFGRPIR